MDDDGGILGLLLGSPSPCLLPTTTTKYSFRKKILSPFLHVGIVYAQLVTSQISILEPKKGNFSHFFAVKSYKKKKKCRNLLLYLVFDLVNLLRTCLKTDLESYNRRMKISVKN